jgi:signal transduction histidine kinase
MTLYTTKSTGLGIGLAIARSIGEAHGGRLEAKNNPDGGATFSFTLPVSEERPRPPQQRRYCPKTFFTWPIFF